MLGVSNYYNIYSTLIIFSNLKLTKTLIIIYFYFYYIYMFFFNDFPTNNLSYP